jgi:hypothetical protein
MVRWIVAYWSVLLWAIPVLIACEFVRSYLGPRFATAVVGAGLALMIYVLSRKIELAKDIQQKQIDNR